MKIKRGQFWFVASLIFGVNNYLFANPTGMSVASGSASAQQSGAQLNVTTSQAALLNWSSFNIQQGETTTFLQPSANSVVLNEIGGANPSLIFGNLNANGTVILANANGFYFGPNSMIKVGGSFIATTAPLAPDFGLGASWQFTGMPPLASIVNYGQIQVGGGKSLFLIAENIKNHGQLDAPGGNIGLYAGESVLVSDRPDGRGLSATVQVPKGSVNNFGQITADAGTIALQAQVVNQNGIIQADSMQNQNGVIELVASDQLNLGVNSRIRANGDNSSAGSSGGVVTIKSGNGFTDQSGSKISVTGGSLGGDGGSVEISAPILGDVHSQLNGSAQLGFAGGTMLLDPVDLALDSGSLAAYSGFAEILFQTSGNITLNSGTTWNLSANTGTFDSGGNLIPNPNGSLVMEAGGNIIFGNNSKITDFNNWSVTLDAGYDFVHNVVPPGDGNPNSGNIYLNGGFGGTGNGAIQTGQGAINLTAANSILVGSGYIRTSGGGSITAIALAGDISVGTMTSGDSGNNSGYNFSSDVFFPPTGYRVASQNGVLTLGGISTAAGGNVTLTAGNDINPSDSATTFGVSGAFGSQLGNVTLIAGNQVLGNFNVANGKGTIRSGVQVQNGQVTQILNPNADAGSPTLPLTLGLIDGSWNVWAGRDIYVEEVRNPNGTFNDHNLTVPSGTFSGNTDNANVPARSQFLFNYAPDAAANFWAGNSITLDGGNLTRDNGENEDMPPIYAPILTLNAGAGGINILNSIILYPSSEGSLQITTRDGGNLVGAVQSTTLTGIIMSDSGLPDYEIFAQGHATTPLHLNDSNPVRVNISGDINSFGLTVPTFAQINVVGDTYNFGFLGQNLSPLQTTSINVGQTAKVNMENSRILNRATDSNLRVGGAITYRGDLTTEQLTVPTDANGNPDPISSSLFDSVISGDPALAGILRYDSGTGILTFVGIMSDDTFLLNPTDANSQPVAFTTDQLASWKAAIAQLYSDSQSATLGDQGFALSGPGHFNITANNIDLGISGGITVIGPDSALAAISPFGADINVTTAGNLDMTSTKIANEGLLGGINLNVGGTLDVGGELTTFGDPNSPKGIFTTSGGNVSVTANGNVNVDGSRIAAYDGGNVTVKSQTGDVNAGAGGSGYVTMNALELDPTTGELNTIFGSIPGSGILATTLPGGNAALGNISINAPNGSVNASLGGVVQIAFNGEGTQNNFVDVNAGHDINASGSGIIGSNIKLQAGGNINGLVIGSSSVDINSAQNVDVTAFSGGDVNINASGEISGTIIGGGSVNVSGDSITASLISESVSASGNMSGATEGIPQSNVAKNNAETADDASTVTSKTDDQNDDQKKKGKQITLAQKVSRVTVILPPKKVSQTQTSNPGT
jgi:filamentous hemagglutinin family protein